MPHVRPGSTRIPKSHGKLGVVRCVVTRQGFIAVGGGVRDIADGQEVRFERVGINARRNGGEYTSSKTAAGSAGTVSMFATTGRVRWFMARPSPIRNKTDMHFAYRIWTMPTRTFQL